MSETNTPESYFVKIRGRVLGPLAIDRLKEMAQQGQLSRVHTFSTDGQNWKRASEHPDLCFEIRRSGTSPSTPANHSAPVPEQELRFQDENTHAHGQHEVVQAQRVADEPDPQTESNPEPNQRSPVALTSDDNWYYGSGTDPKGPYSLQQLRTYIKFSEITNDVGIWRPGFDSWIPAEDVAELKGNFSESSQRPTQTDTPPLSEVPESSQADDQPYRLAPEPQKTTRPTPPRQNFSYTYAAIKRSIPWLYASCIGMALLMISSFVLLLLNGLNLDTASPRAWIEFGTGVSLWLMFVVVTITLTYHLTSARAYTIWRENDDLNLSFYWLRIFWVGFTGMIAIGLVIVSGLMLFPNPVDQESPSNTPTEKIVAPPIRT